MLTFFLFTLLGSSRFLAQHINTHAAPTFLPIERRLFGPSLNILDSVILYDSPAFQDPSSGTWTAAIPAFVSLRQVDIGGSASAIFNSLFGDLGINIGDRVATLAERIQMFTVIGESGKEVDVTVDGCSSGSFKLSQTAGLPDLGHVSQNMELGTCGTSNVLVGKVHVDDRDFNGTIFPSPPDGFGVISDIDDTVKITNVLDIAKSVEATFLDTAQPVAGMPDVYASLKTTLSNPQFIYVSGSPSQLYPFIQPFIDTTYPPGPILLQNVTLTDVSKVVSLSSPDEILSYKLAMIDRIQEWYPQKKFIAIGDSTQRDPETYGGAFRKFGGQFISCIWIRKVDGANNTDERFSDAFTGVPPAQTRVFVDSDIASLSLIDVAGGNC